MTWENSKKSCKILRLSEFDNWRLPTIDELQTLVIKSKTGYYYSQRNSAKSKLK